MAWACSGSSNVELIGNLRKAGIISCQRVYDAMAAIDRRDYSPESRYAYEDSPQYIGYDATISAPHMHGHALEKLKGFLKPGMKVLDVGSGSGYLTACMASMVGPDGLAVGIEHIRPLVDISIRNVRKTHAGWLDSGRIKFIVGDGRLGYADEGPYDCIHVGAAADETPVALLEQLKAPGRLFVPVGTARQYIFIYDKDKDGHVEQQKWLGVQYVPLTDADTR